MDTGYDMHPAKRRKMSHLPPREIGIMRKSHQENGSATFLGSSSGIYFIRVVYNAFARRSAYLNQAQQSAPKDNLVPGEDDQLQRQSPRHDAAQALRNELWMPHELDHHRAPKFNFDNLVRWTRSYFDHWHPIFPYILGPTFLRTLEQLNSSNGWSKLTSAETILVRSVISISLLDRRQMNTSTATRTKGIPVPAMLVFRTVDQAMQSLHALFCDPPTVPLLQAAFSVQIFLVSLLRLNAASRLGGVITRTAFHLGLHRCPARYSCFAPDEVTIRRRLFWSIYCLERYLSQALGIPLSIRDDDVDSIGHLRLLTHLAKFARVRGLIVELRNKCFAHAQEPSSTATQINGELAQWWNEVYEDVYLDLDTEEVREEHAPAFSQSHRLLLIVLRHESIISMNRPLLAADQTAPEYKTALQICIESSRSLIAELRRSLPPSTTGVPPIWPSFTWAVWMSCLILIYAAWEGEFAVSAASRIWLCEAAPGRRLA
ncbi:fungal-specific transcription factor domain-containing protein [Aspergillus ambiguus]|uniref:CeGAL family transcription factor n=1 Tax=Aspergillus ambiguus TaxID=176160 RepID=UPI003CCE0996